MIELKNNDEFCKGEYYWMYTKGMEIGKKNIETRKIYL